MKLEWEALVAEHIHTLAENDRLLYTNKREGQVLNCMQHERVEQQKFRLQALLFAFMPFM